MYTFDYYFYHGIEWVFQSLYNQRGNEKKLDLKKKKSGVMEPTAPVLLSNKDRESVDLPQELLSDTCINPVFMSSN